MAFTHIHFNDQLPHGRMLRRMLKDNDDDPRWPDANPDGFNFRHTLAAAAIASGGKIYQIEYLFTPVTGEPFMGVGQFPVIEVIGS